MNLIYEELIKQSKPVPDFARTDQYQFGLTLHGTIENPAFIRFVERVGKETTAFFDTHDWMIFAAAAKGEKDPRGQETRIHRLLDLGVIEKGKGRTLMLSRRFYEFTGQKGVYTRKKGLDREQNLELLFKHIREQSSLGAKLEDLCQVLSALKPTHVQSLVRTLQNRGLVHVVGVKKYGRWFPGSGRIESQTELSE